MGEALLEASAERGVPLALYPIGNLVPSKDLGEPCVLLRVCFGQDVPRARTDSCHADDTAPNAIANLPSSSDTLFAETRFLVGHAYSIRATCRAPGLSGDGDNILWVRLRDPRRARLFWVPWPSVITA